MPQDRGEIGDQMDRAARGDNDAFAELATAVQDGLYRFGLSHGLRSADAAEAVQEALLRAYGTRRRWRRGGDALAWLYGITLNVIREFRRKAGRLAPGGLDVNVLAAIQPVDGVHGSARHEEAETLAQLASALADLPPRQREAVTCRYLRQLSVEQTAAAMGCAEGTVKAAVWAALAKLRVTMADEED